MLNKSIYCGVVSAVLFCASVATEAQDNLVDKDFYAAIAERGQQTIVGRPMDTIAPVDLPVDKLLPWAGNKSFHFTSCKKITTAEEMNDALEKLRNRYLSFLQDLTPDFCEERLKLPIDSMQFRYELPEDCGDFNRLLQGEGEWNDIAVPYYHGPQGVSTDQK